MKFLMVDLENEFKVIYDFTNVFRQPVVEM